MKSSIDILYFPKEISTLKEKLDKNQIIKLRQIRNSLSDEFEKYYKPSETVLNYIDQLLVVNECKNGYNKRRELNTRLKFIIIFLGIWRFLIDENIV